MVLKTEIFNCFNNFHCMLIVSISLVLKLTFIRWYVCVYYELKYILCFTDFIHFMYELINQLKIDLYTVHDDSTKFVFVYNISQL